MNIVFYVDGSQLTNRSIGIGVVGFADEKEIVQVSKNLGTGSVQMAEYSAILKALYIINKYEIKYACIYSDCEDAIKILNNQKAGISGNEVLLFKEISVLADKNSTVKFAYIPSAKNKAHEFALNGAKCRELNEINLPKPAGAPANLERETYVEAAATLEGSLPNLQGQIESQVLKLLDKRNSEIVNVQENLIRMVQEQQMISNLLVSYISLKDEISIAKDENKAIKAENIRLSDELNRKMLESFRNQDLTSKLEEKEKAIINLNRTNSELKTRIQNQEKERVQAIQEHINKSNEYKRKIESLEKQIIENGFSESLKVSCEQLKSENEKIRVELTDKELLLSTITDAVNNAKISVLKKRLQHMLDGNKNN